MDSSGSHSGPHRQLCTSVQICFVEIFSKYVGNVGLMFIIFPLASNDVN